MGAKIRTRDLLSLTLRRNLGAARKIPTTPTILAAQRILFLRPPPSEPEEVEDWEKRSGKGRRRDHSVQQGKEAEDIKFLAWRAHCVQTVIAAAGRHDDEAFPWIQACATESPEDLCIPGEGWVSLDRKIAAGLMRIYHGELGRELTQMSTTMYNDNQTRSW